MLKKTISKVASYATYPIKKIIRNIIIEMIQEERSRPLYESLKEQSYNKNKFNIYDAMLTMKVDKISFSIEYIDPTTKATKSEDVSCESIASFKHALEQVVPAYPHFSGANVTVHYDHKFGKQQVYEFLVSSCDKKAHSCDDLHKVIQPMLMWLRKHPELLI